LDQVKPIHLLDFYANLKEDGIRLDRKPGALSPATIDKHHRILSSMFSCAVDWELIEYNPALNAKPGKLPKREPVSLDKDPAIALLKALEKESLKYKVITLLAACTGMRRGELLGIGDTTIDLNNHIIKVKRASQHTKEGDISFKGPKNNSSYRSVPFPETITPLIKELITYRNKKRKKCGDLWVQKIKVNGEWVDNDLFFTQWNGKPMHPNTVDTWFNKFRKDNELPDNLKFHGLRHTNITLLIKAGIDVGTVGDNAGHNQKSTTLAYDDPLPSARRKLASILDETLDLKDIVAGLLGKDVNIYRKCKTNSNDEILD
jgi:integrase